MASRQFIQTAALFLLAYGVAPWASTVVIHHFSPEQTYSQEVQEQVLPVNIVALDSQ